MKKIVIEPIDNIEVFSKFLENHKPFRELPEQYRSTKFCMLYMRIYNYILSIPKENIVVKNIQYQNREYIPYLFKNIIYKFIEAKDFYHWKDRIYSLISEKICPTNYRKFELLYRSKAKEFFDRYKEKMKATMIKKLGVPYAAQSKEVQDKMKATCLEKYGKEHVGGWLDLNNTSKEADEICEYLDSILNIEDTYYAKKNKEYRIGKYKLDFCIPSIKLGVEYDGCYWHGLLEGQKVVQYSGKYITVEERHRKDLEKTIAIEKAGYKLFRIREDEYRNNKTKCLENLIKEIKNYVHSLKM